MKYFILYNDEQHGPHTIEELEEYDLNPSSRLWAPGWPGFKAAAEVPEVMDYFAAREAEARKAAEAEQAAKAAEAARKAEEARAAAAKPSGGFYSQPGQTQHASAESPNVGTWQSATQPQGAYAGQPHNAGPDLPPPPSTDFHSAKKEREWFMGINNREVGPLPESSLVSAGLMADTLVWCENMPDWMPAANVPELAYLLPARTGPMTDPVIPEDPEPLNIEYEMANPWIFAILGLVATLILIIVAVGVLPKYLYPIGFAMAATPTLFAVCSLISAGRVSEAKNAKQYILAGRRCGAARAWGWASLIMAGCSILSIFINY